MVFRYSIKNTESTKSNQLSRGKKKKLVNGSIEKALKIQMADLSSGHQESDLPQSDPWKKPPMATIRTVQVQNLTEEDTAYI